MIHKNNDKTVVFFITKFMYENWEKCYLLVASIARPQVGKMFFSVRSLFQQSMTFDDKCFPHL